MSRAMTAVPSGERGAVLGTAIGIIAASGASAQPASDACTASGLPQVILETLGVEGLVIQDKKLLAFCSGMAELGRTVARLDEELRAARERLVRPGTIAFFGSERCPSDWEPVSKLVGRYVVGAPEDSPNIGQAVGQALTPNENRPTGDHIHRTVGKVFTGGKNGEGSWGNGPQRFEMDTTSPILKEGQSLRPGTNAPYVQLLACRKS